jgi:nitrogen fixation protein NifU and related proteins
VYSQTLLDHFQFPRNVGELERADATAEEENPVCGDRLKVWLRIDGDRIAEMRWRADGCVPAIAAASLTSELVVGMQVDEARTVDRERIAQALGGLPARKAHAAAVVATALRRALEQLDEHQAGN